MTREPPEWTTPTHQTRTSTTLRVPTGTPDTAPHRGEGWGNACTSHTLSKRHQGYSRTSNNKSTTTSDFTEQLFPTYTCVRIERTSVCRMSLTSIYKTSTAQGKYSNRAVGCPHQAIRRRQGHHLYPVKHRIALTLRAFTPRRTNLHIIGHNFWTAKRALHPHAAKIVRHPQDNNATLHVHAQ